MLIKKDYIQSFDAAVVFVAKTLLLANGGAIVALLNSLANFVKSEDTFFLYSSMDRFADGFKAALVFLLIWKFLYILYLSIEHDLEQEDSNKLLSFVALFIVPGFVALIILHSLIDFVTGVNLITKALQDI